jgi:hypothetical protein
MTKRVLPHKKEGYVEKPLYRMSAPEREKRVTELFDNVKVSATPVEQRRELLMELRGN